MLAFFFAVLLGLCVFTNLINLPGNWLCVVLIACWYFFVSKVGMDIFFWGLIIGAALIGEVLEWIVLAAQAKKAGASKLGTFAGMIGAFVGAILGCPFFLGLGALVGAVLGAFLGCLGMELLRGTPYPQALRSAKGTMLGRLLGAACKCAAGCTIVALTVKRLWPDNTETFVETVSCLMAYA